MSRQMEESLKVLRYQEGEPVIKQGDYGISIYRILSGKVQVLRKSNDAEVPLAVLGPGEVIGEMAFLSRNPEVSSASVRALEDTELEVWHAGELAKKYEKIPAVIKTILGQAFNRLERMNRYMDKLAIAPVSVKSERDRQESNPREARRRFYRKEAFLPCRYTPASRPKDIPFLNGKIKDLSMGGMCLEVPVKNEAVTTHEVGEAFHIDTVLPNGKDLSVTGQIVSVKKGRVKIRLGMQFQNLPDHQDAKRVLGFYLLPTR